MKMDHDVVVREQVTEKYLLNELDPEARDQFEQHFFDCQQCAFDIRAASEFVELTKRVLAEEHDAVPVPVRKPVRGWRAWLETALRPAIAAPALALLLLVVGYQNLITLPQMMEAANSPQVLGWTSINVSTRGDSVPKVTAEPGKSFMLFVNIPPQQGYARYTFDLLNSAGQREWTLTVPAESATDALAVRVPGAKRAAGVYTLAVRGVTPAGQSSEIGRNPFELQFQK